MKIIWTACLLSVAMALPASASDKAFALVHLGPAHMTLLDTRSPDVIEKDIINAHSVISLPQTDTTLLPGQSFDAMLVIADYNCASPGVFRHNQIRFLSLSETGVVHKGGPSPWANATPGSPHDGLWRAVCKGELHPSGLTFSSTDNQAQIVASYREIVGRL